MDNVGCNKVQSVMRKVKKKQVKDELDRQKQAEKKKRRLEKALATSAAIISELEKKKQTKKEEQQRLDEEGAAIAEAVALHVLIGEDSEESSCKIVLNNGDDGFNPWDYSNSIDVFVGGKRTSLPCQDSSVCSIEGIKWVSNGYRQGCKWGGLGSNEWSFSARRDFHTPYLREARFEASEFSTDLIAAQAVSALQIAEDCHEDTIVLDGRARSY